MLPRWSKFSKFALVSTVSILLASLFFSPFPEELSFEVAALTTKSDSALGVYDPDRAFDRAEAVLIEHHFVTWRPDNADELTVALDRAKQAHRLPMITLESWPWEWNGMGRDTLLQDIVAGKYDPTLRRIFQVMQQHSPQPILIRWGHEMEIVGQYPWSTISISWPQRMRMGDCWPISLVYRQSQSIYRSLSIHLRVCSQGRSRQSCLGLVSSRKQNCNKVLAGEQLC